MSKSSMTTNLSVLLLRESSYCACPPLAPLLGDSPQVLFCGMIRIPYILYNISTIITTGHVLYYFDCPPLGPSHFKLFAMQEICIVYLEQAQSGWIFHTSKVIRRSSMQLYGVERAEETLSTEAPQWQEQGPGGEGGRAANAYKNLGQDRVGLYPSWNSSTLATLRLTKSYHWLVFILNPLGRSCCTIPHAPSVLS